MYNTKEMFKDDGLDLKDVLKTCIYNYYLSYKNKYSGSQSNVINIGDEYIV